MIDVANGDAVYYYHFDGVGSVIALSDVNSLIVERYSYDVFGEPNRTSDVNNPYLFTGRRYDNETDLYYYRARYYDYYIGRFLQTDPIGYAAGLNLYTYVGNNPVMWVDPFGLIDLIIVQESGQGSKIDVAMALAHSYETNESIQIMDALIAEEGVVPIILNNRGITRKYDDKVQGTILTHPIVYWDPTSAHVYLCGEKAPPFMGLFHELVHVLDVLRHGRDTLAEDSIRKMEVDLAKANGFIYPATPGVGIYRTKGPMTTEPISWDEFMRMWRRVRDQAPSKGSN